MLIYCRLRIAIVAYGQDGSAFGMVFFGDVARDLVDKPVDVLEISLYCCCLEEYRVCLVKLFC